MTRAHTSPPFLIPGPCKGSSAKKDCSSNCVGLKRYNFYTLIFDQYRERKTGLDLLDKCLQSSWRMWTLSSLVTLTPPAVSSCRSLALLHSTGLPRAPSTTQVSRASSPLLTDTPPAGARIQVSLGSTSSWELPVDVLPLSTDSLLNSVDKKNSLRTRLIID